MAQTPPTMSDSNSSREASATRPGTTTQAPPAKRGAHPVLDWMKRNNVPLTRENYIGLAYGKYPPDEEWTQEHEATLPPELQER